MITVNIFYCQIFLELNIVFWIVAGYNLIYFNIAKYIYMYVQLLIICYLPGERDVNHLIVITGYDYIAY